MITNQIRGSRYGARCGATSLPDRRREPGRRKDDRAWMSAIMMALLILAIGMMIGYGWRAYRETPEPRRDFHAAPQIPEVEKRWIEQRHKHHGISASIEENGQHYFYRDGKKCKL